MYRSASNFTSRLPLLLLGSILSYALPTQADPLHVALVLSDESSAYQAFSDSLRSRLSAGNFKVTAQRADEALGASDLYIAVGMKAASRLAASDVPTLDVFVSKNAYDKLLRANPQHANPRSAVFLDQPIERQVALMLAALPNTRRVGVLYATPPPELQNVRHLLAAKNIRLHDQTVDEKQSLNDALNNVLSESEVLFVMADADIYNASTIRNILLTSYRKQVPLVGISQAFVTAGALCAVFTTPDQFAEQAAAIIQKYDESDTLPAANYPSTFEVLVNMQVARSLDLHIKDAVQLRDEIRRIP